MKSILIAFASLMIVTSYCAFVRADDEKKGPVTGVLIDQMCGAKMMAKDDPQAAAMKHAKSCAMKDACANSGFAVISGNKMYKLDDKGAKMAKDYLAKNPNQKLLLEGHCDWRGTAEYNLSLGDRRASAVKKYLLSLGVVADKLETLSKGSLEAAKNGDDASMAKDRRVDLVVSKAK